MAYLTTEAGAAGGIHVGTTAPEDTNLLWIDPSDETEGGLPSGTNIGDILVWNGISWVAQQPSRLPAGYQEVEYIEGTGTQCIDTGIYLKGTSKVVLDFEYKAAFTAWAGVFGKYTSDSTNFCISWNSADGKVDFQHSSARLDNKTFLRNKRYLLSFGSNEVEYVDFQGTYSKATFVTGETLWLFAYSHSAKAEKIWSFRYYESDVELNHFIPCYRKSDNEIGMFDIVNNQFYTNTGTGTFIKGPDV